MGDRQQCSGALAAGRRSFQRLKTLTIKAALLGTVTGLVGPLGVLTSTTAAASNPFDPGGYIEQKEQPAAVPAANHVNEVSIYKLDGRRYLQFASPAGAVLLPGDGAALSVSEQVAVCPQHLRLVQEVMLLRRGAPLEADAKSQEAGILALIESCRGGKIAGPTLRLRQADGATIEVKAKEEKAAAPAAKTRRSNDEGAGERARGR